MTKLTVSLVAVLALAVAGCGAAAEQNDYVDAVNAEQNQLLDDVSAVVSGPVPTTSAEAAEVAHKPREPVKYLSDLYHSGLHYRQLELGSH